jgi:HPt (histidine-containing phosphotransfer) domain-containing protein
VTRGVALSTPTAPDARNGEAVLSKTVLRSLYGSDNMQRIVNTFLTVTETMLAELEVAIGAQDDELIRKTLHELKSATLEVRAQEMARLCFELEVAARKSDHTEMVAIYAALAHAFVRVKALGADGRPATAPVGGAPSDPLRLP